MMKKITALMMLVFAIAVSVPAVPYSGIPGAAPTPPGTPVPPVNTSFDINAYLSEPLVAADKFDINIYDTISMRDGALGSIEATDVDKAKSNYMNMDPFIQDLLSMQGLAIVSIDCLGSVAEGKSTSMSLAFSILDTSSKVGIEKSSTGFMHSENGTVLPYDLILKKEVARFEGTTKKGFSINCPDIMTGMVTPDKKYTISVSTGSANKPKNIVEWTFKGTLYVKVDRHIYDNVPMGTYRTLIKIDVTTGK